MFWLRLHRLLYWLENYFFWAKVKRKLIKISRKEAFEDYNKNEYFKIGHKPPSRKKAVVLKPNGAMVASTLNKAAKWIIENYPDAAIEKTNGNSKKIIIIYDCSEPFSDSIVMEIIK